MVLNGVGDDIDWSGIAKGAAQGAATAVITRINAQGQPEQVVVPVKEDGIPKPLLFIGAGILGLVLIKMLTGSKRATVANPSRRRHHRRRRRGRARRRR